jgi:acyl-CoA synthetase (NDP forming)
LGKTYEEDYLNFDNLFNPKTIAVIGVSLKNERHPANVIYNKIHLRYPVKVYAVNPSGGQFQREQVYTDITEIPDDIDLAVIAARAKHVPDIMQNCIQKQVGGATVISGGFAETGRKDLQDQLVAMATN